MKTILFICAFALAYSLQAQRPLISSQIQNVIDERNPDGRIEIENGTVSTRNDSLFIQYRGELHSYRIIKYRTYTKEADRVALVLDHPTHGFALHYKTDAFTNDLLGGVWLVDNYKTIYFYPK